MEADDLLLSQVSKFSATPPTFDPADVHIVMWERQTPRLPLKDPGVNPEKTPGNCTGAAQQTAVALGQLCANGSSNGSQTDAHRSTGCCINGVGSVLGNKLACCQNGTPAVYQNGTSMCENGTSQAVCQNNTSQAMCQNNTSQAVCQNGTSQAVCQNGTSQAMCQNGTSQGVCQNGTSQAVCQNGTSQAMCQNGTSQAVCQNGISQAVCQNGISQAVCQNGTSQAVHKNGTSQAVHQNGTSQAMCQNGTTASDQTSLPAGHQNGAPAGKVLSAAAERLARMRSKYAAEPPPSVVARRGPAHLSFAPSRNASAAGQDATPLHQGGNQHPFLATPLSAPPRPPHPAPSIAPLAQLNSLGGALVADLEARARAARILASKQELARDPRLAGIIPSCPARGHAGRAGVFEGYVPKALQPQGVVSTPGGVLDNAPGTEPSADLDKATVSVTVTETGAVPNSAKKNKVCFSLQEKEPSPSASKTQVDVAIGTSSTNRGVAMAAVVGSTNGKSLASSSITSKGILSGGATTNANGVGTLAGSPRSSAVEQPRSDHTEQPRSGHTEQPRSGHTESALARKNLANESSNRNSDANYLFSDGRGDVGMAEKVSRDKGDVGASGGQEFRGQKVMGQQVGAQRALSDELNLDAIQELCQSLPDFDDIEATNTPNHQGAKGGRGNGTLAQNGTQGVGGLRVLNGCHGGAGGAVASSDWNGGDAIDIGASFSEDLLDMGGFSLAGLF